MLHGSCNCGAVQFEVHGQPFRYSNCHCGQCRKQSGNFWASANAKNKDLVLTEDKGLRWFAASDIARRGFCGTCGAFLFWKADAEASTAFALGAIDGPVGHKIQQHIFVDDKGDYYELNDTLPKRAQ